MPSIPRVTVALVVATVLTPVPVATANLLCSAAQLSAYNKLLDPPICNVQEHFKVCDDSCLASKSKRMNNVPDCFLYDNVTMFNKTAGEANKCLKFRTDTKTIYMPTMTVGIRQCTVPDMTSWVAPYSYKLTKCTVPSPGKQGCSDDCLKQLEQSILAAPACTDSLADVWVGEYSKDYLMRCIEARGESVAANRVMNTVMSTDGSFKVVEPAASMFSTSVPSTTSSDGSLKSAESTSPVVSTQAPVTSSSPAKVSCGITIVGTIVVASLYG